MFLIANLEAPWNAIHLFGNYVTANTIFNLRTTLNGMDFKLVSHGLWSEKQNMLLQYIHKKFWILTNERGNNLKRQNRADRPCPSASFSCLTFFLHLLV